MSDKRTRNARRLNAGYLMEAVKSARMAEHVCPHCGKKGEGHWIQLGLLTLEQFLVGKEAEGFYSCSVNLPSSAKGSEE